MYMYTLNRNIHSFIGRTVNLNSLLLLSVFININCDLSVEHTKISNYSTDFPFVSTLPMNIKVCTI